MAEAQKAIKAEFDKFFEFPTDDKQVVSSVSCRLFADHWHQVQMGEIRPLTIPAQTIDKD